MTLVELERLARQYWRGGERDADWEAFRLAFLALPENKFPKSLVPYPNMERCLTAMRDVESNWRDILLSGQTVGCA